MITLRPVNPADLMAEVATLQRQLHAARYAFHKVVQARYREAMERHDMDHEKAEWMYAEAMRNYDGIVENAVSGASHDANDADMKRGFGG